MSHRTEPSADAIAEEQGRARLLRATVDLATQTIVQGRLGRAEAEDLVASTRRRALELFPGRDHVWDLVLAPRFRRLLDEFTDPSRP